MEKPTAPFRGSPGKGAKDVQVSVSVLKPQKSVESLPLSEDPVPMYITAPIVKEAPWARPEKGGVLSATQLFGVY